MRVSVGDRTHLRDLISFLRECGCVAEQAARHEVEVYVPAAPNQQAAETELAVYLAAWRVKSGADAEIVG